MSWRRIHYNSLVLKHELAAPIPTHQIQSHASLQLPWAIGESPYTHINYRRAAFTRSESHATDHSKHWTASAISNKLRLHSHGPRGGLSLQRQPCQPVERRILRRHESRARYSELLKVCNEVVRAAGVCGTTNIDPSTHIRNVLMPITTVHEQRRGPAVQRSVEA